MNPAAKQYRGFVVEFHVGSMYTWIRCEQCGHQIPIDRGPLPELLDELDAHRSSQCKNAWPFVLDGIDDDTR